MAARRNGSRHLEASMTAVAPKKSARAVADLSGGTIIATVEIAAPPDRVFRALTDPEEIVRWWGSPETYRTTEWVADLRVGGRWRAGGRAADGRPFAVEGEFVEVDPPRKLVQTWKADWDGGHVTSLTYRLEPIPGGTRVTVRHEGFGGRPEAAQGHTQGWEAVLAWLERHVAGAAPTRYFLCRLLPPRPTFARDMTEAEGRVMQEHAAYWAGMLQRGTAVVFGPVADPKGAWGVGIVGVQSDADVRALEAGDPAILSGLGFRYEILPMLRAVVRP
jgi:uncharacterized protein YndB with AHSA1/START domain